MSTAALFDMEPVAVPTPGGTQLSADQRRTLRRRNHLAAGIHPATRRALHPDAPRVTKTGEPGDGPRCGGCAHLLRVHHGNGYYFKCEVVGITSGAGTDVRRWWPACTAWVEAT